MQQPRSETENLTDQAADDPPFIVAEVSTNWPKPWPVPRPEYIGHKFEQVIEHNRRRGYRLVTFDVSRVMQSADEMNETIIAVFEKVEEPTP